MGPGMSSNQCPDCAAPFDAITRHHPDCFSCHGDTSRPCLACYGALCTDCGCFTLDGEPYSDDPPPEVKLAVAVALNAKTIDEAKWEQSLQRKPKGTP